MGAEVFMQSGTFQPADYGLKEGDWVQVICVGAGGAAGTSSSSSSTGSTTYYGGSGGGSGYLTIRNIKLSSADIANGVGVTVGAASAGNDGGASSFGQYATANGGSRGNKTSPGVGFSRGGRGESQSKWGGGAGGYVLGGGFTFGNGADASNDNGASGNGGAPGIPGIGFGAGGASSIPGNNGVVVVSW